MKDELIENKRISNKSQEIDLIELIAKVWSNKRVVFLATTLSIIFGVFFAILLPNRYTSGATFIPQMNSNSLEAPSGLSGLASLAGIDIGNSSNSSEIPPALYPRLVLSVPFRKDLLGLEIEYADSTYILSDYLLQKGEGGALSFILKYTIGLPKLLLGKEGKFDITNADGTNYILTEEDAALFEHLDANLLLELNDKEGFVGLSFIDEDKFVAAQVAEEAIKLLQERIIKFRNQSAKELLTFSEEQYLNQERKYNALQDSFAIYKDKNLILTTAYAQVEQDRLSREISIAASVLEQLASQVEQAKLKVNQDTPIFMIIEPVYVAFKKSAPKRSLVVIAFAFFGLLSSIGYVLLKDFLKQSFKQIVNVS